MNIFCFILKKTTYFMLFEGQNRLTFSIFHTVSCNHFSCLFSINICIMSASGSLSKFLKFGQNSRTATKTLASSSSSVQNHWHHQVQFCSECQTIRKLFCHLCLSVKPWSYVQAILKHINFATLCQEAVVYILFSLCFKTSFE